MESINSHFLPITDTGSVVKSETDLSQAGDIDFPLTVYFYLLTDDCFFFCHTRTFTRTRTPQVSTDLRLPYFFCYVSLQGSSDRLCPHYPAGEAARAAPGDFNNDISLWPRVYTGIPIRLGCAIVYRNNNDTLVSLRYIAADPAEIRSWKGDRQGHRDSMQIRSSRMKRKKETRDTVNVISAREKRGTRETENERVSRGITCR